MKLYGKYKQESLIYDDDIVKLSESEVNQIYQEWQKIERENSEKYSQNEESFKSEIEKICTVLKNAGIEYKIKNNHWFYEKIYKPLKSKLVGSMPRLIS